MNFINFFKSNNEEIVSSDEEVDNIKGKIDEEDSYEEESEQEEELDLNLLHQEDSDEEDSDEEDSGQEEEIDKILEKVKTPEEMFEINNELDLNEYSEDFTKKLLIEYFSTPYMKNNKFNSYIIDISFLKYCKKWSLNRKLNIQHWNRIYKSYKEEINDDSSLIINNTISLGLYENNFYIIDGQHRTKAVQELLKDYVFTCKIRVDLYYTNNYDDMIKVLSDINSTFPLNIENELLSTINNILTHMKNKYSHPKSNIFTCKKSNRPYINENDMIEKLRKAKFLISSNNINSVLKNIDKINEEYSQLDPNKLKFDKKKISVRMITRAGSYSCFLGFDTEFNWINRIDKIFEEKFKKKNPINLIKDI